MFYANYGDSIMNTQNLKIDRGEKFYVLEMYELYEPVSVYYHI